MQLKGLEVKKASIAATKDEVWIPIVVGTRPAAAVIVDDIDER